VDQDLCKVARPGVGQWLGLVAFAGLLTAFCFVMLPALADWPAVQARTQLNSASKIDGAATFYTDHEFMRELLDKLD
jgi:hypothetical protein